MTDDNRIVGEILAASQKFDARLGRFVLVFSRVEKLLYRVLLKYANVSPAVGAAIFSGTRLEDMAKFISAILDNTRNSESKPSSPESIRATRLKYVFAQLTEINGARNRLIHGGLPIYSIGGITAVRKGSRIVNDVHYEITLQEVQAMIHDLQKIHTELSFHKWRGEFDEYPAPLPSTWLYKSPEPNTRPNKGSKPQKRLGRRRSSPE